MTGSPQLEDGFIRIANELMEAILGFGFSHREVVVLFSIIRKTYGYGKKTDDISASQLSDLCKIPRQHVTTTLNQLAQRNVITKVPGKFGTIIGIQKSHRKWISSAHLKTLLASPTVGQGCPDTGHVPPQDRGCPDLGQVASPTVGHTKDNLTKDNLQKKGPREEVSFKKWMEACKDASRDPIPADDPVFAYADEMHLPLDYIRYGWVEFKRKYGDSGKRYKNWNQHFQNAIRENWYGIWFDKDGAWQLTTRGKQIEKELRTRQHD